MSKKSTLYDAQITRAENANVEEVRGPFGGPAVCPHCGALFSGGRWTWEDLPEKSAELECPACSRIADGQPAGIVEISGDFFREHHSEIMHIVQNISIRALSRHPLERVIEIMEDDSNAVITTTATSLALRIGDALVNSFEGNLDHRYGKKSVLHVNWKR